MHLCSVKLKEKTMKTITLLLAACGGAIAQDGPGVLLDMRIENRVVYSIDTVDIPKLATIPGSTNPIPIPTFGSFFSIADIVSINGKPVKGAWSIRGSILNMSASPNTGQAIADINRASQVDECWEILQPDGTPIGTIVALGLSSGSAPPGAPLLAQNSNAAVTGGTGAFLGVRGQQELVELVVTEHTASVTEDPSRRRINGAGAGIRRLVLHLIPMERPVITGIFHGDFTPVNASSPAKAGEILILMATGLGPTRPGVDPGQPFPADKLLAVNSPVEATISGQAAEMVNCIGWPGLRNTYRIDVRVPAGIVASAADVQLTVAWIGGPAAQVPVR
jgi:hypothetical protein